MIWFWLGFFVLVGLLLFLDLGVLHRKDEEPTLKSAAMWTVAWMLLGLSFAGVVYLMYQNHWLGADLKETQPPGKPDGANAAATYVAAYLLEQALSIDNIFVVALTFAEFKIGREYQHRVLFWGIIGAVGFRLVMLGGGVELAKQFDWIFYIFGAVLVIKGAQLFLKFFKHDAEEEEQDMPWIVRRLRSVVRIEQDHGGKLTKKINGRHVLTILALCLVTVEWRDIVFALDSIPAVLSVSQESFIVVTSNIFAVLGLRSLYFVLAGMMAKFKYLEVALGVLLVAIGAKMILHHHVHISHIQSLIGIAVILSAGVLASVIDSRRNPSPPEASGPGPASPSP